MNLLVIETKIQNKINKGIQAKKCNSYYSILGVWKLKIKNDKI